MKQVIGIDPGVGGAIAVVGPDGYFSEDIPVMANGKRSCINAVGVRDILKTMGKCTVYLERVHSMPGQGVASMFSMGDSFGCLRGVVMAMGYPLVIVTPQTWKKYFKLGKEKEPCRAKAIQLFPEENLSRKKDVDRAEALLIAHYGANQ